MTQKLSELLRHTAGEIIKDPSMLVNTEAVEKLGALLELIAEVAELHEETLEENMKRNPSLSNEPGYCEDEEMAGEFCRKVLV